MFIRELDPVNPSVHPKKSKEAAFACLFPSFRCTFNMCSTYFPQIAVPQGRTEKRKIIFLSQRAMEEGHTLPQKQVNINVGNSLQSINICRTAHPLVEDNR